MIAKAKAALARLWSNRRGNVLMIFAFAMIPMVFATGMGIDYARAARLKTKLNAIADAAALAAVTQPMMNVSDLSQVHDRAQNMFDTQADGLEGLTGIPIVKVNICQPPMTSCSNPDPDHPNARIAEVSYTAKSTNVFGGLLRMTTISIGGSSSATAVAAPNMDFYLALDTSPSMALPTTTAGIQTLHDMMKCSFACHSNKIENYAYTASMPNGLILDNAVYNIVKGTNYATTGSGATQKQPIDANGAYVYVNRTTANSSNINNWCKSNNKDICVYNADGTFVDSYWYALNQGIRLRVTDERSSIQDLMTLAKTYAAQNKRTYRAALYTFDHNTDLKTIVGSPTDLDTVSAAASKVDLVTVNDRQSNGCPQIGCTNGNKYLFTSFKSILDKMLTVLPNPSGQGSDAPGDTPQAFLFLVTDGMSDEDIGFGRTRTPMQQAQVDECNKIKTQGVKVAILYTEYTTSSIDDDKASNYDQWQRATNAITVSPNIADMLTKCASPGLMYTVKTDESMSTALQDLFTKALATARLNQ